MPFHSEGWLSDTWAAVLAAVAGAAAGRGAWVTYKHYGRGKRVVMALLLLEALVAILMGLFAFGAVEGAERILMAVLHEHIELSGWPAFSIAGACGWLGPRGLNALLTRGRDGLGPGEGT